MAGYIKLHRKLLKWGWYGDTNTFRVFMHLLLIASYEDNEFRGHKIKAGQAVVGRKKLAEDLKMSEQSVRTALDHLKSTNEITIKSTNKFSVITIENWAKYQGYDEEATSKATNKSPNEQPTTNHTQEGKKVKNKEDIYIGVPEEIKPAFMEWVSMRKTIKKPVTSKIAVTRAMNTLDRLAPTIEEKIELIELAVERCWLSFYKPKEERNEIERDPEKDKAGGETDHGFYGWSATGFTEGGERQAYGPPVSGGSVPGAERKIAGSGGPGPEVPGKDFR